MSEKVEVRFTISPFYEDQEEDYNTRQISVMVDSARLAVINCHRVQDKWQEPKFVVLKGPLTYREMTGLGFSMTRAQELMKAIGRPETKMDNLELLIEDADGETYGLCRAQSKDE